MGTSTPTRAGCQSCGAARGSPSDVRKPSRESEIAGESVCMASRSHGHDLGVSQREVRFRARREPVQCWADLVLGTTKLWENLLQKLVVDGLPPGRAHIFRETHVGIHF